MAKPRLEPTPEFDRLGLGFDQNLDMRGKTEDEVWAIVLDPFAGQDRIRLRDFLDGITRDDDSDADHPCRATASSRRLRRPGRRGRRRGER